MTSRLFLAELIRTIDGDSIELRVDTGFFNTHTDHFRLANIDTPEGVNGIEAHKKLDELLSPLAKGKFPVSVDKPDKYGRWLVTIPSNDGQTINQQLIDLGFAKPYHGGKKPI